MNHYIVGQVIFLRARLSDPATPLSDPDDPATQNPVDDPTIGITVYKPDGTTVAPTPSLSHDALGVYTTSVTADIQGNWEYVTLSTGAAAGAGRGRFYVAPIP